jgi:hypothetical protein
LISASFNALLSWRISLFDGIFTVRSITTANERRIDRLYDTLLSKDVSMNNPRACWTIVYDVHQTARNPAADEEFHEQKRPCAEACIKGLLKRILALLVRVVY